MTRPLELRGRVAVASLLMAAVMLPVSPTEAARVVDKTDLKIDLGGDIKALFDLGFPYEHMLMPDGLQPAAAIDFRLRFSGRYRSWLSWEFHHAATARYATESAALFGASLNASSSGEALPLSWTAYEEGSFTVSGRVDRASLAFHAPGFDVRFGRQPVSFGTGFFFTPLDLLSPYGPQVVDREYKPGVDAVRFDAFVGATGRLTAVLGVVDPEDPDGAILIGSGSFTVGLFDLDFFVAKHYRDLVLGLASQGSVGPVGVHADLALRVPFTGEDPTVAVEPTSIQFVLGANVLTDRGMTLMAEVSVQSSGTSDSSAYFSEAMDPRVRRGDRWTLGHLYAALSLTQELSPVFSLGAITILNLTDPSALIGPNLAWSVASNVDFVAGAFLAVGERPAEVDLLALLGPDGGLLPAEEALAQLESGSEFGLMPHQAYLQLRLYF